MSEKRITLLRKLKRRKHRYQSGRFVAEGWRAVMQILRNGRIKVDYLVFDESADEEMRQTVGRLAPHAESIAADKKEFRSLADTENPQGVLAVCHMPPPAEIPALRETGGLLVAMNRIQDPGNAGTVYRTAAWFGATGVLCDLGTADLFHPKTVRSTAGALGVLPWWTGDLDEALTALEAAGWKTLLLDAGDRSESLIRVNPGDKCIIVVGNEAAGLDDQLKKEHRTRVRIPGRSSSPGGFGKKSVDRIGHNSAGLQGQSSDEPHDEKSAGKHSRKSAPQSDNKAFLSGHDEQVESLNASVALSIALYELTTRGDRG